MFICQFFSILYKSDILIQYSGLTDALFGLFLISIIYLWLKENWLFINIEHNRFSKIEIKVVD